MTATQHSQAPDDANGAKSSPPAILQNALVAMERASLRAREIARQTGTAVIVMRNGEIVRIRPGIDEE